MPRALSSALWGLLGVLIGAAIVGVGRAQEPIAEELKAKRLVVCDEAGQPSLVLTSTPAGPALVLRGADGDAAALLTVVEEDVSGPAFYISLHKGDDEVAGLTLAEPEQNQPYLILAGRGNEALWHAP